MRPKPCARPGFGRPVLLATRHADPDTLFFQRRLRVEGDTELGLAIKNTMDGMDWDDLPTLLRGTLQLLGRLLARAEPLRPGQAGRPASRANRA